MKIKTPELIGAALDWAVYEAGINDLRDRGEHVKLWVYEDHVAGRTTHPFSTDWAWGGPIIERERIELLIFATGWEAQMIHGDNYRIDQCEGDGISGPTPLIAAMRCYVASKLGAEVEVPDPLGAPA